MAVSASTILPPSREYPSRTYYVTKDPAALITAGYDSIRIQRRVTRTAAWTDIPNAVIYLESSRVSYAYVDPRGRVGYEYRAVLQKSTGAPPAEVAQPSTKGVDTAYEAIMTVKELKEMYLWGQDSGFITDDGQFEPDYAFVHYILYGIRRVETKLDLNLMPDRYVEREDWVPEDMHRDGFIRLSLDHGPVTSVESIQFKFPGGSEFSVPEEWIQFKPNSRVILIVPDGEQPLEQLQVGARGFWRRYAPGSIYVDYCAGFLGAIPEDLREVVGMEAAFGPLNVAGDLIGGAGLAGTSISMDGLSESVTTTNSSTNAGFGARILTYEKKLPKLYKDLVAFWKGPRMAVA